MTAERALIASGAGKWGEPTFPKFGWSCVDMTDLGEPDMVCEMCERAVIRFVHQMRHPSGLELSAGCVCAGVMEGDEDAAVNRDRDTKNAAIRLVNRRKQVAKLASQLKRTQPLPDKIAVLEGIRRKALKLEQKASADERKYSPSAFFHLWWEACHLSGRADAAVDAAKQQHHAYRLQKEIADRIWTQTAKGARYSTSQGDSVQAFHRDDGMYGFGLKLKDDDAMKWSRHRYPSKKASMRAGIVALKVALRKAGRLPKA